MKTERLEALVEILVKIGILEFEEMLAFLVKRIGQAISQTS